MGGLARGGVHDMRAYGTVCDLDTSLDVVALATPHQSPPAFGLPDEVSYRSSSMLLKWKYGIALQERSALTACLYVRSSE